jgi:hypothetical protein
VAQLLGQFWDRGEVLRRLARGVPAEAAQALDDVGRVPDLAELAVADDRDAGLDRRLTPSSIACCTTRSNSASS